MKTQLLLPLLILFKFVAGANNMNYYQVTIQFGDDSVKNVKLCPYVEGILSSAIQEKSKINNSYLFLVPKMIIPCELSLKYKYNSFNFEQKVFVSNTHVKLIITPSTNNINWCGNVENKISKEFNHLKDLQLKEIISFRLASKSSTDNEKELNEQKKEYFNLCVNFNQWIDHQTEHHSNYWVSKLWNKEKIPLFVISENPSDQYRKLLTNYSKYEKYDDTSLLNTSYYNEFLTDYIVRIEILALLSSEPEKKLHEEYARLLISQVSNSNIRINNAVRSLYKSIVKSFQIELPFLD